MTPPTYACQVALRTNSAPTLTVRHNELFGTLPDGTEVRGDAVLLAAADWDQAIVFALALLATVRATQPDLPQPGLEGGMARWADRGPVAGPVTQPDLESGMEDLADAAADTDREAIPPHVPDLTPEGFCSVCHLPPPPYPGPTYTPAQAQALREDWAELHPPKVRQRAKRDR